MKLSKKIASTLTFNTNPHEVSFATDEKDKLHSLNTIKPEANLPTQPQLGRNLEDNANNEYGTALFHKPE